MARPQRRFLLKSSWTALVPLANSDGERHFTVVVTPPGEMLIVRAVLTNREYYVPVAELGDDSKWASGWLSLAGFGDPQVP